MRDKRLYNRVDYKASGSRGSIYYDADVATAIAEFRSEPSHFDHKITKVQTVYKHAEIDKRDTILVKHDIRAWISFLET